MKVVTTAPCRISLFGGGTDVGEYADKYGGECLNLGINIRQKVTLDIGTRTKKVLNPSFIDKILLEEAGETYNYKQEFPGEITGGLGSSAALTVALVAAATRIKGEAPDKSKIAERAWDIEVSKLGLYGGKQDQYCSAYGGVCYMTFNDGVVGVKKLHPGWEGPLERHMLLFHIGENRKSPTIQEGLRTITPDQKKHLDKIKGSVKTAYNYISGRQSAALGGLMDRMWKEKKQSNRGVTTGKIDELYDRALYLGAHGGKILGAGGGGYLLLICPENKREDLISDLGVKHVPFNIDYNGVTVWHEP